MKEYNFRIGYSCTIFYGTFIREWGYELKICL